MLNRIKHELFRFAVLASLACGLGGAMAMADHDVAEAQRRGRSSMAAQPPAATPTPSGVVNINTAGETELGLLPGIGPSKAAAIITYRQRGRRFRRVEDLLRVRGIGRATFRRLRPMLTVDGPTTLAASSAGQPAR